MDYDAPMSANYMRYHTMVPVKEFLPYLERARRAPKDAYISDQMYESFIENGPTKPVMVVFGKNGHQGIIKIVANQEVVLFAERSGLEEVPALFSFQRQA